MSYIVSFYFTKNNGHSSGFGCARYSEYLGFEPLMKNIVAETGNDDVAILNVVEEPVIKERPQPIGLKDKNGVDICVGSTVLIDKCRALVSFQNDIKKEHFLQYGAVFTENMPPKFLKGFNSFGEINDDFGLDDLEVIE